MEPSHHLIDWQLNLYTRTYNALRRNRITTIEQLEAMSDSDILRIKNVGHQGLQVIREQIAKFREDEKV